MIIQELTLFHYLFIGLVLFVTGIIGSVFCKNIIKMLISIEFILTGININFAAFANYCGSPDFDGYVFVIFYTAVGAVELAIALYIFYLMYKRKSSDNIEKYGDL